MSESKRENRRKRRKRNQIISYTVMVIVVVAVIVGCTAGVRAAAGAMAGAKEAKQAEREAAIEASKAAESAEAESAVAALFEEESAEETVTEYTSEDALNDMIEDTIAGMTLEQKAAGLFFITPEQLTGVGQAVQAGEGTKEALAKYPVGGLIYFSQNIQSEEQVKEMLSDTVSYSIYPLFLGVDEEGGKVSRVSESLKLENVGAMADIGAEGNEQAARDAYTKVGTYLLEYGFNVDFAPVADVLTNADNTAIGDRAFSSDAETVGRMVAASVEGLQQTGVSACIKHFPGHGDTAADSHTGAAQTNRTREEMEAEEFVPFRSGIGAGTDMVMVGHISAPELTGGDNMPSSLSESVITGILRGELGYDGIIITDALNMGAITEYYEPDVAAIMTLKAGADMVLMPEDFVQAYEGVLAALQDGTISQERVDDSLRRIYRVKLRGRVS